MATEQITTIFTVILTILLAGLRVYKGGSGTSTPLGQTPQPTNGNGNGAALAAINLAKDLSGSMDALRDRLLKAESERVALHGTIRELENENDRLRAENQQLKEKESERASLFKLIEELQAENEKLRHQTAMKPTDSATPS